MILEIEKNLENMLLAPENKDLLDLYNELKPNHYWRDSPAARKYARIFGLCRLLGVTNLYDIGCGGVWQALFLANYPDVFYTGIDYFGNDNTYANESFAKSFGKRINFQYAHYAFLLNLPPSYPSNNLGIALGWLTGCIRCEQKTAFAFSKDFERIIIDIQDRDFKDWEAKLAESEPFQFNDGVSYWEIERTSFKLYKICDAEEEYGKPLVFGTKFPEEIDMLKKIKYDFNDDKFAIPYID